MSLAACQQSAMAKLTIPGAEPVSYDELREGSGVLAFAEPVLGPEIAPRAPPVQAGPGDAVAERDRVAGAWRLQPATDLRALAGELGRQGSVDRMQEFRDGQTGTLRLRTPDGGTLKLLMIDGAHPRFAQDQPPGLRPAPHRYLIAYRAD